MECRLDDLDERVTALEGVQNRGEICLDSAERAARSSCEQIAAAKLGSGLTFEPSPRTRFQESFKIHAIVSSRVSRSGRGVHPSSLRALVESYHA